MSTAFDCDPDVDGRSFRAVMGRFATGVTVVTALDGEGPTGFTCQSFVPLSLEPPLVALAPAKTSTSWPRMRQAKSFCVNVLAEGQEPLCRAFAISGTDKFGGVAWSPGISGAPRLDSSLAWIECRMEMAHDAGDHELIIGRVLHIDAGEGSPLIFYRSAFSRLLTVL